MGAASLFLVSCALLVPSSSQQYGLRGASTTIQEEDDVIVLSSSNFEELTKRQPVMLVEFFAPWCGHCRHFAPTYSAVSRKLKTTKPSVPCGKVDVTKERELAEKHQIKGFPTVKVLFNGEDNNEVYEGMRTEDAIVKFALERAGPAATALSSIADLENLRSSVSVLVVGFFKRHHQVWSDENGTAFKRVSRQLQMEVTFAYSFESAIWERYNLTSPAVIAFPEKGLPMTYGGKLTSESELEAFVRASRSPAIVSLHAFGLPDVLHDGRPLLFLLRESGPEGRSVEDAFNRAITSAARRLLGVVVDRSSAEAAYVREAVALEENKNPAVCILQDPEGLKMAFTLEGDISEQSITAFIADYFAHKLHPVVQEIGHRDET
mmetsp:Transcript_14358/g.23472  ORF Transcript_14358/g.23472 Transcript_14358/m.23472 type:complete len:378 (-) Transcript_14358:69-1202(-)